MSCLALDEDANKQRAVLVTGSLDKTVMLWRLYLNALKPQPKAGKAGKGKKLMQEEAAVAHARRKAEAADHREKGSSLGF